MPDEIDRSAARAPVPDRSALDRHSAMDDRSESESPTDEAAAAKVAIGRAMKDIRDSVGTAVDVRLWTKKAPWIALGAAAVTGLATAILIRREGKTIAASNGAASGEPPRKKPVEPTAEPAKAGIGASISSSLFELAKFALETAVVTGVREATARRFDSAEARDGAETSANPPR